jgi:hypothetical protein
MVLLCEPPRERVLLVLAQVRVIDHARDFVAQVLVCQVQLGQAAFVVERHRRTICDRLGEI